jgi:hypothetical protein
MNRKIFTILILFPAIMLALFFSENGVVARFRLHDARTSTIDRVYQNGMIAGFNFDYRYDQANKIFVRRESDDGSRLVGDQSLFYRQTSASGPGADELPTGLSEDNFITKFWILRWDDPVSPTRPIIRGSDKIAISHWGNDPDNNQSRYFYHGGLIDDCTGEHASPDWLIKNCLINEQAPAPSLYRYCSPLDLDPANEVSSTINFPADLDIFDLDVSLHVNNINRPLEATLGFRDDSPIKLISGVLGEQRQIGSSCEVDNEFYGLGGQDQGNERKNIQPGYVLDDEADYPHIFSDLLLGGGETPIEYHEPEQPLATFNGRPAKGEWNLTVQNGTLECWCLDLLAYRTVRFAQSDYAVDEGDGVANVLIELSEVPEESVVVDYQTIPNFGSNQRPLKGSLRFDTADEKANGIVLALPILDNDMAERDETVQLLLSNPSNEFGLSERSRATLTVRNDDEGEPLPIPAAFLPMLTNQSSPTFASAKVAALLTWQELGSNSASGGGISNNSGDSDFPATVSDGFGRPHVVWRDLSSGTEQIYLLFWDGTAWQELDGSATGGGISNTTGRSRRPALAFDVHNRLYVAWEDDSSGKWQIYVKRWDGVEWESLGLTSGGGASQSGGAARFVSITVTDRYYEEGELQEAMPYIAYRNLAARGDDTEIYVKRYDESSDSWSGISGSATGGGISLSDGESRRPIAVADGKHVYLSYHDNKSGNFEVYQKRWNGTSWDNLGAGIGDGISATPGDSISNAMAINDHKVYIVWSDDSSGDAEIYLRFWDTDNPGWRELDGSATGGGISNNGGASLRPGVAVSADGRPHVVWEDDSSGNLEIYARYWNGSSWAEHQPGSASGGGISANAGSSERPSIYLGGSGVPYVAWMQGPDGARDIYFKWFQWWD